MNVENKRDDRKKKIREIAGGILCIAVLLFIVMQIMLPETGIGGMVNEGSMAVLFFGVGAVCAYAAIKKRKEDKSALVLGLCLAVLACVPGGWISGKVAADLIEGPKTIRLTSVTTEELNGLSGLISHHYYLCGRQYSYIGQNIFFTVKDIMIWKGTYMQSFPRRRYFL